MHLDAANIFLRGQQCIRVVIPLSACDHMNVNARRGKFKREIAQELAGGGVVRMAIGPAEISFPLCGFGIRILCRPFTMN